MTASSSTNNSNTSCFQCQTTLPDDAAFCPECGSPSKNDPAAPSNLQTIGGLKTYDSTHRVAPTRQNSQLEPGSSFVDRYVILEQIGLGGMGVVYRAKDELTDKIVALKLIHPNRDYGEAELEKLKQEGVTARDIRHKNVVAVYDVGLHNSQPFISMEFLKGKSLREWHRSLQQSGHSVPPSIAYRIVSQVLMGLVAAHEDGVIHRDLKPENVMVVHDSSDDVQIKILDFGIARAVNSGSQSSGAVGTLGYMAPEQVTSPDLAGPAADLYAVSVMFYELLVDVLPQGHWQPPSGGRADIPRQIDYLIEQGLSNRPANRLQSAQEYLDELNRIAGVSNSAPKAITTAKVVSTPTSPTSSAGSSSTLIVIIGCILSAIGLMAFCVISAMFANWDDPMEDESLQQQQMMEQQMMEQQEQHRRFMESMNNL